MVKGKKERKGVSKFKERKKKREKFREAPGHALPSATDVNSSTVRELKKKNLVGGERKKERKLV